MYGRLVSGKLVRRSFRLAGVLRTTFVSQPSIKEASVPFDPPSPDGMAPSVSSEVQEIADRIGRLTLVDVVSLNKLLKHQFDLPDVAVMPTGVFQGFTSVNDEQSDASSAQPETKTSFTVRLVGFDEKKKIAVIKEVKSIVAGMNLVQAKKFVESLPQTLREDVGQADAEKLKQQLAAVGGECAIE